MQLNNRIASRPEKVVPVSVKVSTELYAKADHWREKNRHTWTGILIEALKLYVEENEKYSAKAN